MKIYIVIFGGAWSWESGAFALSYLLAFLMVIPAYAKICEKPNEFAKIQVNPTKSNLFFYGPHSSSPIGSSVTLAKNIKTTKRTQFKKCKSPIKH
jgi:hypothetical protein